MDGINDRFNVELEVLTPLAIGAGAEKDWVAGADFVIDKGKLYKLSLQKMVESGIDMSKLAACFENSAYSREKGADGIRNLIGGRLDAVSEFSLSLPSGLSSGRGFENPVKAFVKNQLTGRPVVPGSSVKGAIRSVILERLTKGDRETIRERSGVLKQIFGSPEDGSDFMRFVKLSDIEFRETALVNTKIFNLQGNRGNWQGGWKHGRDNTGNHFNPLGFNTVYESVMPDSLGLGSLMLSGKMFGHLSNPAGSASGGKAVYSGDKKKRLLEQNNGVPAALFREINEHTAAHLKKEREFFEKYGTDRSRDLIDFIDDLLRKVEEAEDSGDSCIFKMSAGSGFHSITGDWQFGDYWSGELDRKRNKVGGVKPKSRKVAIVGDRLCLMGFVRMSIAPESVVKPYEVERDEYFSGLRRKFEERKTEVARMEEERREKTMREQEQSRRKAEYDAIIKEAETCSDNSEALELYRKAGTIWPDGQSHRCRISALEESIRKQKLIDEHKSAEETEREAAIKAALSTLDEKSANDEDKYLRTNFKQVKNFVEGWLKKSGNGMLPEEQDKYLQATLHRIYGSLGTKRDEQKEKANLTDFTSSAWKTVTQWCGEERARSIFESVVK